jgi:hypothetical protein
MAIYASTIFVSAFLLFLVQPLIAKQVLPWFGGSAAVWSTCLVFFQFVLLLGYAYSDLVSRKLAPRVQAMVHTALLVASLLVLPVIASPAWKPTGDQDPSLRILGLLIATIGLPYLLLSTTGPLLQSWFARARPSQTSVYRLFALSNAASLIALLSYPFLIEPWVSVRVQSLGWSAGYALFVTLCAVCAWIGLRRVAAGATAEGATAAAPGVGDAPAASPGARAYLLWIVLSGMATALLLAVTNHITHDVASVPFLWLLPLTLYLLSFIFSFEGRGWYSRRWFLLPLLALVAAMAWSLQEGRNLRDMKESVALFCAGLFVCCMFFHGELADSKPAPAHLTRFYLAISLGGTLGGILIAFVAPRVFTTYYEFPLILVLTLVIAMVLMRRNRVLLVVIACTAAFAGYEVYHYAQKLSGSAIYGTRSFYGVLKVQDRGTGDAAVRQLMHGIILHGEQSLVAAKRAIPTTYYGPTSGVGRTIKALADRPIRVAVVGLGTGTIAAYGKAGDVYRFYEIDPRVVSVARTYFSYLGDSAARVETVLGDARLSMEREAPQQYDVIVLDAFSSDSIPVHLITREAMAVYLKHLNPGGVIAFHISNRFLSLAPVLWKIGQEASLNVSWVVDGARDSEISYTEWVLVSREQSLLARPEIAAATRAVQDIPGLRVWTDESNNLFRILK